MTDPQWVNLLLQGGPVVPLIVLLWMLYRGNLVTSVSRDRELAAKDQQMVLLERIIADVTRDRDQLIQANQRYPEYTDRAFELADAAANYAQRRALPRPPFPPREGSHG